MILKSDFTNHPIQAVLVDVAGASVNSTLNEERKK
jgi:hypothetical protein